MIHATRDYIASHPARSRLTAVALVVAVMIAAVLISGAGTAMMVALIAIPAWLWLASPHIVPTLITWVLCSLLLAPVGSAATVAASNQIATAVDGAALWALLLALCALTELRYTLISPVAAVVLTAFTTALTTVCGVLMWPPAGFAWALVGATIGVLISCIPRSGPPQQIAQPPDAAELTWQPLPGNDTIWTSRHTGKLIAATTITGRRLRHNRHRGIHVGRRRVAGTFDHLTTHVPDADTLAVFTRSKHSGIAVHLHTDGAPSKQTAWIGHPSHFAGYLAQRQSRRQKATQ